MNVLGYVIIGSGPAGASAAIYLSQAGKKVHIFVGPNPGGQLMKTDFVENYPGIPGASGKQLGQALIDHAKKHAELIYETVISIKKTENGFVITTDQNKEYLAKKVIIATGSNPKKPEIKSILSLENFGVSYCAVCDGQFFKNLDVAVVGGGNSAFESVLYLSNLCKKVYLIHRGNTFRAFAELQNKVCDLQKIGKVEIILENQVIDAKSHNGDLSEIILKDNSNTEKAIHISGLFYNIGHIPQTYFAHELLELNDEKYILVDREQRTNINGVYACGDCCVFRDGPNVLQAVIAAAQGCIAALHAAKED